MCLTESDTKSSLLEPKVTYTFLKSKFPKLSMFEITIPWGFFLPSN